MSESSVVTNEIKKSEHLSQFQGAAPPSLAQVLETTSMAVFISTYFVSFVIFVTQYFRKFEIQPPRIFIKHPYLPQQFRKLLYQKTCSVPQENQGSIWIGCFSQLRFFNQNFIRDHLFYFIKHFMNMSTELESWISPESCILSSRKGISGNNGSNWGVITFYILQRARYQERRHCPSYWLWQSICRCKWNQKL